MSFPSENPTSNDWKFSYVCLENNTGCELCTCNYRDRKSTGPAVYVQYTYTHTQAKCKSVLGTVYLYMWFNHNSHIR